MKDLKQLLREFRETGNIAPFRQVNKLQVAFSPWGSTTTPAITEVTYKKPAIIITFDQPFRLLGLQRGHLTEKSDRQGVRNYMAKQKKEMSFDMLLITKILIDLEKIDQPGIPVTIITKELNRKIKLRSADLLLEIAERELYKVGKGTIRRQEHPSLSSFFIYCTQTRSCGLFQKNNYKSCYKPKSKNMCKLTLQSIKRLQKNQKIRKMNLIKKDNNEEVTSPQSVQVTNQHGHLLVRLSRPISLHLLKDKLVRDKGKTAVFRDMVSNSKDWKHYHVNKVKVNLKKRSSQFLLKELPGICVQPQQRLQLNLS